MMYVVNRLPVYFLFCLFGGALPSESSYFYTVKFIICLLLPLDFCFLQRGALPHSVIRNVFQYFLLVFYCFYFVVNTSFDMELILMSVER